VILIGFLGVVGWLGLFGLGLLVSSKAARENLLLHPNPGDFLFSLFTYTPTNAAMLAVMAGLVGGCAKWLFPSSGKSLETAEGDMLWVNEAAAGLRGFVVYLAFLAGVYVAAQSPFAEPTQEQYARLSGTISLFAFVVGFDPTVFGQLISMLPGQRAKKD
jgi:hypothetical protein